jgi:hypothetical protein
MNKPRSSSQPHSRWAKGNLHTHTTRSDGDTEPGHVAEWYHAHGYDFLCLSDHDHLTILEAPPSERSRWPLLIRGQEVTSRAVNVHVNGFGLGGAVEALEGHDDVLKTLQTNIDRIRAAGGLASVNHPNFKWAVSEHDLKQATGYTFMEVFNGHPMTNNHGGGGRAGTVDLWDRLLSAGKTVWGIATDDAHHLQGEFAPDRANPGRGWVQVRTEKLTEEAVLEAMEKGDFYASTGVKLLELRASRDEIIIEIDPETDARYTTSFTCQNGGEVHSADGLSARYRPSRLDRYVRATVRSSRGALAWTQPVFLPGW